MTEVNHREPLDGDGKVVGSIDADGMVQEFSVGPGETGVSPLHAAASVGRPATPSSVPVGSLTGSTEEIDRRFE